MISRITINPTGNHKLYHTGPFPKGAQVLGTVKRNDGREGAFVQLAIGTYVQLNEGVITHLPQYAVICERERLREAADA